MRGMVVGEGGRSSGVLLYCSSIIDLLLILKTSLNMALVSVSPYCFKIVCDRPISVFPSLSPRFICNMLAIGLSRSQKKNQCLAVGYSENII